MAKKTYKNRLPPKFWLFLIVVVTVVISSSLTYLLTRPSTTDQTLFLNPPIMSFTANVISATQANTDFRQVLFTGERSQLVLMDIKPGEDIGMEVHKHVE